MTRDDYVFAEALALPAADRKAFVVQACGGDVNLRARVEALLAVEPEAQGFLEQPLTARHVDRSEERPGDVIGRYKLLQKIGEGGMGVVYLAAQEEPVRRRVALKIIKLGMDTKLVVGRLEAERQALAMMDHPNIARVYDGGATEAGRPYFVMELVRGVKVTQYCDEAKLSTRDRLLLFIQVCQAIQHAHHKGIVHRDIKPSNILVTVNDGVAVPKVIDFGIAKAIEGRLTDETLVTQFNEFIGTPAYMSPEQIVMTSVDVDTRSDVYSLGVLLYELLAGRTPFEANELLAHGIEEMRKTIREKEPVRPSVRLATLHDEEATSTAKRRSADPSKLLHQLRGDLDWIVMKCLEKDRARRYQTANGLAADINRHLTHEPVTAHSPTIGYRLQKSFRRHRLGFIAATAIAFSLVVGIVLSTWQMLEARKAQRETEIARTAERQQRLEAQSAQMIAEVEQERANLNARKTSESHHYSRRLLYATDMNLAQQSLNGNNVGKARRLLDRHRPAPGEEDLRGWEWRYLWQLTRSSALVTLVDRPTARGWSVSFSADGTRLAVGWLDGSVDLWDIPGRRLIWSRTFGEEPEHRAHVAFSPVGNLLAATAELRVIKLYDLDSGRESILWRAPEQSAWRVCDLAFSPDGSRVTIYAKLPDSKHDEVYIVNVAAAQIERRYQTDFAPSQTGILGAARLSPDNRFLYLTKRHSIQCIDLTADQEIWESEAVNDFGIPTMDLSPDGRLLASGSFSEDHTIRIWEAATGRLVTRLVGNGGYVHHVVFSRDGQQLISAGVDQTLRFWDTKTWSATKVLRGHSGQVQAVAISAADQLVASAGSEGSILLWNAAGKGNPDGYRRLPASLGGNQLWPFNDSRVLLRPTGQPPELFDLKRDSHLAALPPLNPSATVMGWSGGENLLFHWNGTDQIVVHELRGAEFVPRGGVMLVAGKRPTGFAYNPARRLLAWSEETPFTSIHLESLASPAQRFELKSDVPFRNDSSTSLPFRFSEDGTYLAAEALDTLRVWNIETGEIVASIAAPVGGLVSASRFAAGGTVLVAAELKGLVGQSAHFELVFQQLTEPVRWTRRFPGKAPIVAVAVSPDGMLVAATDAGNVRLFDASRGEPIAPLLHHNLHRHLAIAFSPDGRRLMATGQAQEIVRLWDVGTWQEVLTLSGNGSNIFHARWSADGDSILAGVPWQAWTAPSWAEIAAAEAK